MVLVSGCVAGNKDREPGVLVSAGWVHEQLEDPSLVLLQVGTLEGFDSIHLPGARHIETTDFMIATDSLRNELPPLPVIAGLLRSVGVNMESRVVLYYEEERFISRTARIFLALDHAGLGDKTHVMNGGLPIWIKEGFEVTDQVTAIEPGDFVITKPREVVMRAQELEQHRWDPAYIIVDSRSLEEYSGELDSTGRQASGGHIEGAYFLSYEDVLSDTASYLFREDAALRELFQSLGMDQSNQGVYYCGSGVRAAVNYLAARHLGFPALLYDGSIQEWEGMDLPQTSPVIEPGENVNRMTDEK